MCVRVCVCACARAWVAARALEGSIESKDGGGGVEEESSTRQAVVNSSQARDGERDVRGCGKMFVATREHLSSRALVAAS